MKKIQKNNMKTFSDRVLEAVLAIPFGRVTTYGRIARACGAGPMASQSITGILGKAYKESGALIPFHRIVYADGSIWADAEHYTERLKLYKKEGIEIAICKPKNRVENSNFQPNSIYKIKNFKEKLFDFE
ncbi:MAG: MGMT family protein [Candidatus Pacebacteria bacterium]|nr:MGMT family protein [Candidatus Paceibacterota bacterium]